jgi:hypothetical protein
MVNGGMFKIVGESLFRSFQNTIIMPEIVTYVVNDALHSVEVKQELIGDVVELRSSFPHEESIFVDLYNSFDQDGILFRSSNSNLPSHLNHHVYHGFPRSISHSSYVDTSFLLNVADCLKAMSLNYDTLHIEKIHCILVCPKRPFQPKQGMDNKYDGQVWCKVKMMDINNDFNLYFCVAQCLGHLQCQNDQSNCFKI